jgi:uncharacterized Zn-binding protein involved in type VI secretion
VGQPAATQNSQVIAVDTHIVMVPAVAPVPTPLPHAFSGMIDGGVVPTVKIAGQAAAVVGSSATNQPPHIPTPPGVSFQVPPPNRGTVQIGSGTVKIGGKPAARHGDGVVTCDDIAPTAAKGQIVAAGTVLIG